MTPSFHMPPLPPPPPLPPHPLSFQQAPTQFQQPSQLYLAATTAAAAAAAAAPHHTSKFPNNRLVPYLPICPSHVELQCSHTPLSRSRRLEACREKSVSTAWNRAIANTSAQLSQFAISRNVEDVTIISCTDESSLESVDPTTKTRHPKPKMEPAQTSSDPSLVAKTTQH